MISRLRLGHCSYKSLEKNNHKRHYKIILKPTLKKNHILRESLLSICFMDL